MAEIGPVERVSGRSAVLMVGDGIVKFFAILRLAFTRWRVLSRAGRLQNAVPVAKGPGFVQRSAQLQRQTQPTVPHQKGLAPHEMMGCGRGTCLSTCPLRRNQYCNLGLQVAKKTQHHSACLLGLVRGFGL